MTTRPHKLYGELAHWWPLFSPPSQYGEEAEELRGLLRSAAPGPARTLLELGSGGGSLAFHLKPHFQLTLSDLSPRMLEVSRAINPECEHLEGDMTSLRLGRQFDRVLVHDALMYATDREAARTRCRTPSSRARRATGWMVRMDAACATSCGRTIRTPTTRPT